jgi:hypothetical protein
MDILPTETLFFALLTSRMAGMSALFLQYSDVKFLLVLESTR